MWFSSVLGRPPATSKPTPRGRPARVRRRQFVPALEALERRDTPSTTVLTVSPNPATAGQAVSLVATVYQDASSFLRPGTAGGKVTFFDGAYPLGAPVPVTPSAVGLLQGVAQLTTAGLGVGAHALIAKFSGESGIDPLGSLSTNTPSTSAAVTEVVNAPGGPPPLGGITPADITSRVSVGVRRGLPRNRQLVTVTNTSGQAITGPLYLVFIKLPRRVRLRGGSGTMQSHGPVGSPFLLDAVTLLPGGFVNFLASFSEHQAVRFTTEVFAGPGSL